MVLLKYVVPGVPLGGRPTPAPNHTRTAGAQSAGTSGSRGSGGRLRWQQQQEETQFTQLRKAPQHAPTAPELRETGIGYLLNDRSLWRRSPEDSTQEFIANALVKWRTAATASKEDLFENSRRNDRSLENFHSRLYTLLHTVGTPPFATVGTPLPRVDKCQERYTQNIRDSGTPAFRKETLERAFGHPCFVTWGCFPLFRRMHNRLLGRGRSWMAATVPSQRFWVVGCPR